MQHTVVLQCAWCIVAEDEPRFMALLFCSHQVGPDDHVICALSGGVDSTVAATLVHKALGNRLHCVFVDNGLLRYKVCVSEAQLCCAQGPGRLSALCFCGHWPLLCCKVRVNEALFVGLIQASSQHFQQCTG